MATIDEIKARLNPKTAAMFRKASELEIETLATPSLGINMAIGGLRYGTINTIWGNRSSGKTLFCLGLVKEAQAQGKSVAWIDAEKNFDKEWAKRNGVDPDNMLISQLATIADMANTAVDLIDKGIDLLIVDSMSVLLPQSYFDDGDMKTLEKTGQIGTFSKNYGQAVNMINNRNEHTCVVMISQLRNKIGSYGATKTLMGGEAAEFMNSTIIKLWGSMSADDQISGEIVKGDLILSRPIGRPVTWTVTKARGAGMDQANKYNLLFAGNIVGVDLASEVMTYAIEFGIARKSGAWFYYGDHKEQGKDSFVKWIRENPEIQSEIYHKILDMVS